MIKKIVHLADIHIRTYKFHDEYKAVFETLIEDLKVQLLEFKREEVRIVIVGDLFHQKITISNEQVLLGSWFLRELNKVAPVIVVAGNHDLLENNLGRMDSITPVITLLGDEDIKYLKESRCYLDDNVVWCNYSIFEENARPNIEQSHIDNEGLTHIGLFHAPLIGAKTDIGYVFEIGENTEHFEGCDFVMLGDIHKRQEIIDGNVRCVYPGSLIQQNFGETVTKHGYLLWDLETQQYTEHDVQNDNLFFTFKISSIEDIENGTEKLVNG
jgi:DNA repair exonuclease SbcCD nuclease subunit